MADIERLEEVLSFIESHPELHDQSIWLSDSRAGNRDALRLRYPELTATECGTVGCIAGWAVHFWGEKPFVTSLNRSWFQVGAKLLELNLEEADILFFSLNTLDALRQMVKDLANGLDLTRTWERASRDDDGRHVVSSYRRVGDTA